MKFGGLILVLKITPDKKFEVSEQLQTFKKFHKLANL